MPTTKKNYTVHPHYAMLKNMYDAINKLKLWDWLRTFEFEEQDYMFCCTPNIAAIAKETKSIGHTPASFAYCLRYMERAAKNEMVAYYVDSSITAS
jgi:hypothetical protein